MLSPGLLIELQPNETSRAHTHACYFIHAQAPCVSVPLGRSCLCVLQTSSLDEQNILGSVTPLLAFACKHFDRPNVFNVWRNTSCRVCKRPNKEMQGLSRCIGLIDGNVLGIARPLNFNLHHAAYNGHKSKHALTFQTVTTPDGLILHAHGPMAGSLHDWALSMAW